jgi:hypothetical protein
MIGWRTSSGHCHNYYASLWKSENHDPPRFCIEVNVLSGGWKLAVLLLHHGATLQSAVDQLFSDVIIFSIVLSKNDTFLNVLNLTFE